MELAVEQELPDAIIHLGDNLIDAKELQTQFPDTVIYTVPGNCDTVFLPKKEIILPLEGVTMLLTHGHVYHVKSGLSMLTHYAVSIGANLVLYGHTHRALITVEQGITLMNPGQLSRHDEEQKASYGIVEIENGKFTCGIVYM